MTTVTSALGRLEPVELRDIWTSEPTDFTPWLAREENIALLGETIGIELEVERQEQPVGPFRADILCKDTVTGHYVLIENQLEVTDHLHLGQLMTYAAGLDAVTIVWIARRFAEEHRAARDWLNRMTEEGLNFFGLEVELWRIGDSAPAPKFNVVSKPNDWAKTIRERARAASDKLTPIQQLHLDYWTQFREYLEERLSPIRIPRGAPDYWSAVGLGRTGFQLILANGMRDGWSAVYLALTGESAKPRFHLLREQHGATVEAHLGPVEWRELPNNRESQVRAELKGTPSDERTWPTINLWMAETAEKWSAFLRPIVKELDAGEYVPVEGALSIEES